MSESPIHFDDALGWLVERLGEVARTPGPLPLWRTVEADISLVEIIDRYWIQRGVRPDELRSGQDYPYYRPFYDAAWELCRRGILRPGRVAPRNRTHADATGDYFSITEFGKRWLAEQADHTFVPSDPGRLAEILLKFEPRFGHGFRQRASEAVACHRLGTYLASCVMAGAAAESILLAVAIAKSGDEEATLKDHSARSGRKAITDKIVHGLPGGIAEQFKSLCELLNYWRDQAGHGTASTISEIEAFHAISRLLRFAQFTSDNWATLTA
jgi:hypothetical protein